MLYPQDERINVLAPIVRGRKGEFKKELAGLRARGFTQGADRRPVPHRSRKTITLDRRRNHTIEVVVDRLIVRGGIERRLTESVETRARRSPTTSSSSTRSKAATGCSRGGWRASTAASACPR